MVAVDPRERPDPKGREELVLVEHVPEDSDEPLAVDQREQAPRLPVRSLLRNDMIAELRLVRMNHFIRRQNLGR